MSSVLSFLSANRERLGLERYGLRGTMSFLIVTPRFRASRHVVVLVMPEGTTEPALVAKVPRLRDDTAGVAREAANLRAARDALSGEVGTIPLVVALEENRGRPILLETALVGRPMAPAAVRRDPSRCVDAVTAWLTKLSLASASRAETQAGWGERLLEAPLRRLDGVFPPGEEPSALVERTRELLLPLRQAELPLVFEHGDLSHPNVLLLEDGRVGVVDWELAEPRGLPVRDLFFFLTYVAFAERRATDVAGQVAAFHDAFVRPRGWARPVVAAYAERLGLEPSLLTPLFVACWASYTAGLLARLGGDAGAGAAGRPLSSAPGKWLQGNRYFALWRHALAHANVLHWQDPR